MANMRPETSFKIGDGVHPRRPTFAAIASLEARFGPMYPVLSRMQSGSFGMAELADGLSIVLGRPKDGGPTAEAIQEAVFDDYGKQLRDLASFVVDGLSDPAAPPKNPTMGTPH
jgi:hypothetical protein